MLAVVDFQKTKVSRASLETLGNQALPEHKSITSSANLIGRFYSGFDSALYRKLDAKWHFPQENATSHDLKMATCESKPL